MAILDWNWSTDWPLLLILAFAIVFGLVYPRFFSRSSYVKRWEKLHDRQVDLLEQQLDVLRQLNELLKKLTSSR